MKSKGRRDQERNHENELKRRIKNSQKFGLFKNKQEITLWRHGRHQAAKTITNERCALSFKATGQLIGCKVNKTKALLSFRLSSKLIGRKKTTKVNKGSCGASLSLIKPILRKTEYHSNHNLEQFQTGEKRDTNELLIVTRLPNYSKVCGQTQTQSPRAHRSSKISTITNSNIPWW